MRYENIYVGVWMEQPDMKPKRDATMTDIVDAVCQYYNIAMSELLERKRNCEVVLARQMGMTLSKHYFEHISLKTIGIFYGDFDHTTVIHSIRTISNRCDTEDKILKQKNDIIKLIETSRRNPQTELQP